MVKEIAWKWIDEHRDEFIEISDKIWEYAELGLVETKSSKLIAEKLREHDFRVTHGVAGMPPLYTQSGGVGSHV